MSVVLAVAVVFLCVYSVKFVVNIIEHIGLAKEVKPYRIKYITKTLSFLLIVFYAILLFSIWGIEYTQIAIFMSSVFAVIGVALFAQWSILSNITASLIIFFGFPYRVGDKIKVVDKDEDISGVVEEITLFHVLIKKEDNLIIYPNTLILQKAVIKKV